MILFIGQGRLGNQVFQLQFLRRMRRPGERIYAVGLEGLPEVIDIDQRLTIIRLGRWTKRLLLRLLVPALLRPLTRSLRLATYITEAPQPDADPGDGSGLGVVRGGLLSRLRFVDGGYYQSATHWRDLFPAEGFPVRRDRHATARAQRRRLAGGRRCAFVHVRRGDYAGYRAYGESAPLLPAAYYLMAVRELRRALPGVHVVFVTDDAEWARRHLQEDTEDSSVHSGSEHEDFCLMRACDAGVVSNSTFSLAAALLMDRPRLVVAPRYWLGFRSGRWLPPGIEFSHARLRYATVASMVPE